MYSVNGSCHYYLFLYVCLYSTGLKPCKYFSKYFYPREMFSVRNLHMFLLYANPSHAPSYFQLRRCWLLQQREHSRGSPAHSARQKWENNGQERKSISFIFIRAGWPVSKLIIGRCGNTWFAFRINTGQKRKLSFGTAFCFFSKLCKCSLRDNNFFFPSVCYSHCAR